jgi:peptidoglycan hydrolase CwlO-like protein
VEARLDTRPATAPAPTPIPAEPVISPLLESTVARLETIELKLTRLLRDQRRSLTTGSPLPELDEEKKMTPPTAPDVMLTIQGRLDALEGAQLVAEGEKAGREGILTELHQLANDTKTRVDALRQELTLVCEHDNKQAAENLEKLRDDTTTSLTGLTNDIKEIREQQAKAATIAAVAAAAATLASPRSPRPPANLSTPRFVTQPSITDSKVAPAPGTATGAPPKTANGDTSATDGAVANGSTATPRLATATSVTSGFDKPGTAPPLLAPTNVPLVNNDDGNNNNNNRDADHAQLNALTTSLAECRSQVDRLTTLISELESIRELAKQAHAVAYTTSSKLTQQQEAAAAAATAAAEAAAKQAAEAAEAANKETKTPRVSTAVANNDTKRQPSTSHSTRGGGSRHGSRPSSATVTTNSAANGANDTSATRAPGTGTETGARPATSSVPNGDVTNANGVKEEPSSAVPSVVAASTQQLQSDLAATKDQLQTLDDRTNTTNTLADDARHQALKALAEAKAISARLDKVDRSQCNLSYYSQLHSRSIHLFILVCMCCCCCQLIVWKDC